jgi:branched-subunit amino acid aminotransferase/4-amino-4-deoxychorismate lyase
VRAHLVWIDGALRAAGEAVVGVADRGFLLGHGAFETMRCSGGVIRRWDAHRARLEGGLAYLGVAPPAGLDAIPAAAAELAARLELEDAVARLTVSAGEGGAGLDLNAGIQPRLVLTLKTRPQPPQAVSVRIVPGARRAGAPGERFKLSGYGDLIAARREARDGGADRAVVTGPGGVLACADCANLFWIEAGEIFTPALEAGALPGVARAALLAAARGEGLDIAEVLAGPDRLEAAEAAFMTNAAEGVTAISAVNGAAMDPHHPLVRRLRALEAAAP